MGWMAGVGWCVSCLGLGWMLKTAWFGWFVCAWERRVSLLVGEWSVSGAGLIQVETDEIMLSVEGLFVDWIIVG